jgi:hypothetical protein
VLIKKKDDNNRIKDIEKVKGVVISAEDSSDCINNCKFWGYESECVTE